MHCRAVQNSVPFAQLREHGFRCQWTGLNEMAIHALFTACASTEDLYTLQNGLHLFFQDEIYCDNDLACCLLQSARPKLPPSDAANEKKKCRLLFELFKKHGLEAFSTFPFFKEVIHEFFNVCPQTVDAKEVAKNVFAKFVAYYEVYEINDEYHDVISYLIEHQGVDVNALDETDFRNLTKCLQSFLLQLSSCFSTPVTNEFLHSKLDAEKINILWTSILEYLPANLIPGSVDLIRSFIKRGCDVKEAIYRVNFSINIRVITERLEERFHDLLEILETFMDHGARLNPLPDEEPFLHGVLEVYREFFDRDEIHPKLYGFIIKCIERGVDPKSHAANPTHHVDLLSAVCELYDADDKNELIENLCDIGADACIYLNNGADFWFRLLNRSKYELVRPRFNESLLFLLRRGLRTDCIDRHGNNVLHIYFRLYTIKFNFAECCLLGWTRELDDLKFWHVVHALLNAGVQIDRTNNEGDAALDAFKQIMLSGCKDDMKSVCSMCSRRFGDTAQNGSPAHDE